MRPEDLDFFNPYRHGFARVAVAVPRMRVADPAFNAGEKRTDAVVATHPTAASRLARLRSQLPLAERIYEFGVSNRTLAP